MKAQKQDDSDYSNKIAIYGKVIQKTVKWMDPVVFASDRYYRLIFDIEHNGKISRCCYVFPENVLAIINSIDPGTILQLNGYALGKNISVDSIKIHLA